MPRAIVTVREVKNKDTEIDITVPTFKETPGLFGSSLEFQVVVATKLRCFKGDQHEDFQVVQFSVKKSQTEMERLFSKMERNYPGTVFPALPKKSFLTEVPPMELKTALENFLQFVAITPKLCTCPVILEFFGADPMKARRCSRDTPQAAAEEETDDIFDGAREQHKKTQTPNPKPVKRPSLFDEAQDDANEDLFTKFDSKVDDRDDFDLLALAKEADKHAKSVLKESSHSFETGEVENPEKVTSPEAPRLFDDQDYGGAMKKDDASAFILPGSTSLNEVDLSSLTLEDNSDLLNVRDDVDDLLFEKRDQNAQQLPRTKPAVKPKPATKTKPIVKPKPQVAKTGTSVDISGSDDIMKYIRENTIDNSDADLFS